MIKKIVRHRFWISGGIMFLLGVSFFFAIIKASLVNKSRDIKSLLSRARQSYLDGQYENASNLYEKVLILRPHESNAILDLAIIHDDYLDNNERAAELYKEYLHLEPETEKKDLIKDWIEKAMGEKKGKSKSDKAKLEDRIVKLERELGKAKNENIRLEKETEKLSGRLYGIQAEHQQKIIAMQDQKSKLNAQIIQMQLKITQLTKAIQKSELSQKKLKEQLADAAALSKNTKKKPAVIKAVNKSDNT